MGDLAPQFADLQSRLGDLGAPSPPGPPGAPAPTPAGEGGDAGGAGWLSSPWLWVGLAVLLLIGLYFWYTSQKKKQKE